jgi:hypothetical protein
MTPRQLDTGTDSWSLLAARWVFHQGPSTVLLGLIFWGVHANLPAVVTTVEKGYQKNAEQLMRAAQTYEQHADRMMEQFLEDRKLMIELARQNDLKVDLLEKRIDDEQNCN